MAGLTIRSAAQQALDDPTRASDLAAQLATQFNSTPDACLQAMRQFAEQIKAGEERIRIADAARKRIANRNAKLWAKKP